MRVALRGSVVVDDLDVFGACRRPTEADSKLIIYSDGMLPGSLTRKGFETIARGHA